jgi:hypothetical protein
LSSESHRVGRKIDCGCIVWLSALGRIIGRLCAEGLKQHSVSVKIKELLLAAGKSTHVDDLPSVDAHSLGGWTVGDRREDKVSVVFKTNVPAIEEMINAWRQHLWMHAARRSSR